MHACPHSEKRRSSCLARDIVNLPFWTGCHVVERRLQTCQQAVILTDQSHVYLPDLYINAFMETEAHYAFTWPINTAL